LAKIAEKEAPLNSIFFKDLKRWYFWGVIAILLPLLTMALMVIKPNI
jgi:hypothetical protein